jgi:hypothetical protein
MLISFPAIKVDKVKFYACVIYEGEITTASADNENKFFLSVAIGGTLRRIGSTLRRIAVSTHPYSTL